MPARKCPGINILLDTIGQRVMFVLHTLLCYSQMVHVIWNVTTTALNKSECSVRVKFERIWANRNQCYSYRFKDYCQWNKQIQSSTFSSCESTVWPFLCAWNYQAVDWITKGLLAKVSGAALFKTKFRVRIEQEFVSNWAKTVSTDV